MNPSLAPALVVLAVIAVAVLSACTSKPPPEALRAVRTAEIRYDKTQETNRYVGTVQSRHEVNEAFRVGGKVVQRKVDVGQKVREGDVLAVLDDTDYRLAEDAARQQLVAATTQARQAESDRHRLDALKSDGSVSVSDDEKAQTGAQTASATAEAEARKLELARNRLKYTVLRASQSGVVTAVRFEVGQVVAEGHDRASRMPRALRGRTGRGRRATDRLDRQRRRAGDRGRRARGSPRSIQDGALQGVARKRARANVRGRVAGTVAAGGGANANVSRPPEARGTPRPLPLGATATLVVERPVGEAPAAVIPASAITQNKGQPAVWVVRPAGPNRSEPLICINVSVHGYRNDEVLVSGPPAGELVVTAGVQKMAPGLRVALPGAARNAETKQAAR